MATHRRDELKPRGDISVLIGLLGIDFFADRGKRHLSKTPAGTADRGGAVKKIDGDSAERVGGQPRNCLSIEIARPDGGKSIVWAKGPDCMQPPFQVRVSSEIPSR
jgi:hypothetical protein